MSHLNPNKASSSVSLAQQWQHYQQRVEHELANRLPKEIGSARLNEAMQYACLQGGKRFRALLVYVCGDMFGACDSVLDTLASALEMLHAYSLVHDDLPAMDNDDLRRGKPTCHIAYDEATAILVGDALQTQAFSQLAMPMPITAERQLQIIQVFANAAGAQGMCGGQALDIEANGQVRDFEALRQIHRLKTGALIESATVMAGLAAEHTTAAQLALLGQYGRAIGLAFQISDDILDATASSEEIGKTANKDAKLDKVTYVSEYGLQGAREQAQKSAEKAIETARELGDNSGFLRCIAEFVINRKF